MSAIAPVLVSAVGPSLSAGRSAGVTDPTSLKNPHNTGMLVDEVLFSNASSSLGATGGIMAVRLNLGGTQLTGGGVAGGFVPTWLFGRSPNEGVESDSVPNGATSDHYRWKLDSPLWVPPDGYLAPVFLNLGSPDAVNPAITPKITLVGRATGPEDVPPDIVDVPWVTCWMPASVVGGAAASTVYSQNADLYNAFTEPLQVRRFVGRIIENTAEAAADRYEDDFLVRMYRSSGELLVRDATAFGHLFSEVDHSWPSCSWLEPAGFYRAELDIDVSAIAATQKLQAQIGMVGVRQVPRSQLGWRQRAGDPVTRFRP